MGVFIGQPFFTFSWPLAADALAVSCATPWPLPEPGQAPSLFQDAGAPSLGAPRTPHSAERLLASYKRSDTSTADTGLAILRCSLSGEKTEAELGRIRKVLDLVVAQLPQRLPDSARWETMIRQGSIRKIIQAIEEMEDNPLARRIMETQVTASLVREMLTPPAAPSPKAPPETPSPEAPTKTIKPAGETPPLESFETVLAGIDAIFAAGDFGAAAMEGAYRLFEGLAVSHRFGAGIKGNKSSKVRHNISYGITIFLLGNAEIAARVLDLLDRHGLRSDNYHVTQAARLALQGAVHMRPDSASLKASDLLRRAGFPAEDPLAERAAGMIGHLLTRFPRAIRPDHVGHLTRLTSTAPGKKKSGALRVLLEVVEKGTEEAGREAAEAILSIRGDEIPMFLHRALALCRLRPQWIRPEDLDMIFKAASGDRREWVKNLAAQIFNHMGSDGTQEAAETAQKYAGRVNPLKKRR